MGFIKHHSVEVPLLVLGSLDLFVLENWLAVGVDDDSDVQAFEPLDVVSGDAVDISRSLERT